LQYLAQLRSAITIESAVSHIQSLDLRVRLEYVEKDQKVLESDVVLTDVQALNPIGFRESQREML